MAIPVAQVHDVVLVFLLRQSHGRLDEWTSVGSLADRLVPFFAKKQSPGFAFGVDSPRIPPTLLDAIAYLERRLYVDYESETGSVRLTPLGLVVASLHELPAELAVPN